MERNQEEYLGYTVEPLASRVPLIKYRKEELERMSFFQLRDVCERQHIVVPSMDKMNRSELVQLVLQFRGNRDPKLITNFVDEGQERLEKNLSKIKLHALDHNLSFAAKIVAFKGLDTNYFDGYEMPYVEELDGVNAFVVDHENTICSIHQVRSYPNIDSLFLTRSGNLSCKLSDISEYRLVIFPQEFSDLLYDIYQGSEVKLPLDTYIYEVSLLDFVMKNPTKANMPLVIDFGTTNTASGIYIDSSYYHEIQDSIHGEQLIPKKINYVEHLTSGGERTPIIPTIVAVDKIENGKVDYLFGHEAYHMITQGFMGDGFSVFYDIKRWVNDFKATEELTDYKGNRTIVERKEIIRAFLLYIIKESSQRLKCTVEEVFMTYPVKQKGQFVAMFKDVLAKYTILEKELIDEGVAVLYSMIRTLIDNKNYQNGEFYNALIVDCGGGTTDLSTCTFSILEERVSYNIQVKTSYENGDTDFGGNNLTFRIMQLLKVEMATLLTNRSLSVKNIVESLESDVYRSVDTLGKDKVYEVLEETYIQAEKIIPTKFRDYEFKSREEYYRVKNNFFFLFTLAEEVKRVLYSSSLLEDVQIDSTAYDNVENLVSTMRWRLSIFADNGEIELLKEHPTIFLSKSGVNQVLLGDIYNIISSFFNPLFQSGQINDYHIIKMTGQSVKIPEFRNSLKEFVPGKMIQESGEKDLEGYNLKLTCLDGSISYLRDHVLGYTKTSITSETPALPYVLYALTHTDQRITLIHPLDRENNHGSVSRAIAGSELELFLSDADGNEKHIYHILTTQEEFVASTYEEIAVDFGEFIPQSETDIIDNGEVKYFVWIDPENWGFNILPVSRLSEQLYLGKRQRLPFEDDAWTMDYFDGTH